MRITLDEDDTAQLNFREQIYYFFVKQVTIFFPLAKKENSSLFAEINLPKIILYSRNLETHRLLCSTVTNYAGTSSELPFNYQVNNEELSIALTGHFMGVIDHLSFSKGMSERLAGAIKNNLCAADDQAIQVLATIDTVR